ncbi:MAG: ABC transporter ATP-binding protein [Rhodothermales bacterium]
MSKVQPLVRIHDLWKSYGRVEAARGVSFEIDGGEIFGLLGPNGAGKTTTLECVLGLRRPDRGEIEVCGIDARRRPREMKQRIGAALQTTALQEKITPYEALRLFGSFYRERVEPEVLLERFGLTELAGAAFDTLSGGQRQRLALALAFVNKPALVFLDEPTTGLDPQSRRELHEDIREMKKEGRAVLLTTHYIEEAESLCDRVAIIHRGRIIAEGTPRELISQSGVAPTVRIETTPPITEGLFDGVDGIDDLRIEGSVARFRSDPIVRTLAEVTRRLEGAGADITELHVQKATLEDVFIELTGTSLESAARRAGVAA